MQKVISESLLTVIVPVHNIAGRITNLSSWIPDAILENIEVILVHDESQDSTKLELEHLLQENESGKITLLEVKVRSPGLARNAGLDILKTPWYSFADADDFVCIPNLMQLLHETVESKSSMGMGSYFAINTKTGERREFVPSQDGLERNVLDLAIRMGLWRLVFSAQLSGKIRFSQHQMAEDYLYVNQVLNCIEKLHTSQEPVYEYFFGGESNLTSNKSVMKDMLEVINTIRNSHFETNLAVKFQAHALQKLTLSVLKNVPIKITIRNFPTLMINLLSKPGSLVLLLASKRSSKVGSSES